MRNADNKQTRFIPRPRVTSLLDRVTPGLPPDLANRAAARLQISAWLYAFTFFMAAFFPRLIFADERRNLLSSPVNWVPASTSIVLALSVALVLRLGYLRSAATTVLALLFEVVGS